MHPKEPGKPLLEARNLEVAYNEVGRAVHGVSILVPENAIVGIVGMNGAGKTTTMLAIAGFMSHDSVEISGGEILFAGTDCTGARPDAISRLGLALVPEREKVFVRLTTWENLVASAGRGHASVTMASIFELFPRLAERRHTVAGYLSGGEQQMLAIAMAMLSNPKLLLIDELSLGLAPAMVDTIIAAVRELRQHFGLSVLFVEQSAANAVKLADWIYVMGNGRIVLEGPTAEVCNHSDFRNLYLGMSENTEQRSYRDVRRYQKRNRWFG